MVSNISLIKIVHQSVNKNCWLAVDEYPQLKKDYSKYITFYDFIDYEGDVFYYDTISSISNCLTNVFDKSKIIDNSTELLVFSKFIKNEFKIEFETYFINQFISNNFVVLIE